MRSQLKEDEKNPEENQSGRTGTTAAENRRSDGVEQAEDSGQGEYLQALNQVIREGEWLGEDYRRIFVMLHDFSLMREVLMCALCQVPAKEVLSVLQRPLAPEEMLVVLKSVREDALMDDCGHYVPEMEKMQQRIQSQEEQIQLLEQQIQQLRQQNQSQEAWIQSLGQQKAAAIPAKQSKRRRFGRGRTSIDRADNAVVLLDAIMACHSFSKEQTMFLLDCIERGEAVAIVRSVANPQYPVEMMEKLLNIRKRQNAEAFMEGETYG